MTRRSKALAWLLGTLALLAGLVGWQAALEAPAASVRALAGVEVTHILTADQLEELGLAPQSGQLEVSAAGNVLLLAGGEIYEVETSKGAVIAARVTAKSAAVQAFALDRADAVLTIANQHFGQIEQDSVPSQAFPLPSAGMRLAASATPGRVYLFGGRGLLARRIYLFDEDGKMLVLAELPEEVVAVADSREAVYAATIAGSIFRLTPKSAALRLAARSEELGGPIESLAVPEDDSALFFSTATQVYALRDPAALTLVNDVGGTLRWRDGRLYVWDARRSLLIALGRLPRASGG
jgi:hypothetical protein